MSNTSYSSLRYPVASAVPNVNQDIQNLATDLDQKVIVQVSGPSARTALSSKYDGMLVYEQSTKRFYRWDGTASAWAYAGGAAPAWTNLSLAGFTANSGNAPRYSIDATGYVRLAGAMGNTSPYSAPSAIFATLPTGFRPVTTILLPMGAGATVTGYNALLQITVAGAMTVQSFTGSVGVGEYWALDGIGFSTT